jgi:hypothetical protein
MRYSVHGNMAWACGVVAVVAVASTSAQQVETSQPMRSPSPLRISVDLVQVDATVTDEHGRHVPRLGAGDFEVLQDGRRQTISTGSPRNPPAGPR